MDNNTTKSAFDKNTTKESVADFLKRNTYKSPYKVYKHKGSTNSKVMPKKAAVAQPVAKKASLLENVIADRKRRYDPYSVVAPLGK